MRNSLFLKKLVALSPKHLSLLLGSNYKFQGPLCGYADSGGPQGYGGRHFAVLITKCPIYNLFAKKALMLYNRVDLR